MPPVALASGKASDEGGHDYYVDSLAGSDSNPGTSEVAPWQTLAPIHAHTFQPGDTIHLKRGSSWTGQLTIDDSGTAGNPITFTAYGSGDRPVLSNPGSPSNWTRAVVIKADWVILEGILIRDAHRDGVYISGGSDHNIIRDIEVTNVGVGIKIGGQNNLVTRNYIHDLHLVQDTPGGNDDFGATGITFYNSHNEVSYNRLERCVAPSQDYGEDGGGFELLLNSDGNYIHHNWVSDSDGFLEVGMGSARNVTVAYNVSVNNNGKFSLMSLAGDYASVVEGFRVDNNTIVQLVPEDNRKLINFVGAPAQDTYVLYNNVLYVDRVFAVFDEDSFSHDYNLYYLGGTTRLGGTLREHEQIADPNFADLSNYDFRLRPGSPAIDAGVDFGYAVDFDDQPVPLGVAPDLGAFESGEVSLTPTPTPDPNEIIVDNVDPGFSAAFVQDAWQQYLEDGGQHYGNTHYYNRQSGSGQDIATWAFGVPKPGTYEVFAWWWEGDWRPSDVPYTINFYNGATTVRVDQRVNGGQWNLLGTFYFQFDGSIVVSDDVTSGRDVVADAIKLVYRSEGSLPTPIPSLTSTPIATPVPTNTPTSTSTRTSTEEATNTPAATPVATNTPTAATGPTDTPTQILTNTATPTVMKTLPPTFTATATNTTSPIFIPTLTATSAQTLVPTDTISPTSTSSPPLTGTPWALFTPTMTPEGRLEIFLPIIIRQS